MILNDELLRKVLDQALSTGADFAEVYVEDTQKREFSYLDGRPNKAVSGHLSGAGIRLFSGTEQIYTHTNNLTEDGLLRAAGQAAGAMKTPHKQIATAINNTENFGRKIPLREANRQAEWKALELVDEAARGFHSAITQVQAELIETSKTVQIANSEGLHRSETRDYLMGRVDAIAEKDGQKEAGFERTGFLGTPQDWEKVNFRELGLAAAGQAIQLLSAEWAPAGEMPVLLDSGFGGVIFHEACGHGLETTAVAKGASVFCDKLGERLAQECVTAIDDGTLENDYGSLEIDDEGEPTKRTILIENGVLKSYIVDKMGARRTGYALTGSGRRQDYRFVPTSRMRNTFLAPGKSTFEEMIRDIDYGIYAKRLGGGSVSPGTGSYNFAVHEAYLVRNGKIDKQIKGASLIGTGIETLGRIVKVGRDLKLSAGTCGSLSGWIPVTVGQPAILVSKLTVGGKV